ncbi:hypothetical protein BKA56DRAFT_167057 [Ilyonectria sp. MPI-CAGE-AT-0026]|nr:hypothetical protein BKA56DRAFT_167057 [Ilyonectria sp. MPI-CAGE-AT-0026]
MSQQDMADFLHNQYRVRVSRFTIGRTLKRAGWTKKVTQISQSCLAGISDGCKCFSLTMRMSLSCARRRIKGSPANASELLPCTFIRALPPAVLPHATSRGQYQVQSKARAESVRRA